VNIIGALTVEGCANIKIQRKHHSLNADVDTDGMAELLSEDNMNIEAISRLIWIHKGKEFGEREMKCQITS
jgi:hypothetical protein